MSVGRVVISWRAAAPKTEKEPKLGAEQQLALVRTPDILKGIHISMASRLVKLLKVTGILPDDFRVEQSGRTHDLFGDRVEPGDVRERGADLLRDFL